MESTFMLELPPNERAYLGDINTTFDLHVSGTGDGASGIIRLDTNEIEILSGGKGFSEEPSLQVVDDQDNALLTIDPSWIRVSRHGHQRNRNPSKLLYLGHERLARNLRSGISLWYGFL